MDLQKRNVNLTFENDEREIFIFISMTDRKCINKKYFIDNKNSNYQKILDKNQIDKFRSEVKKIFELQVYIFRSRYITNGIYFCKKSMISRCNTNDFI